MGQRNAPMVIEQYAGKGTLGIRTYQVFSRHELLQLADMAGQHEADCLILDSHAILSGYESADGSLQVSSGYKTAAVKGGAQ